MRIVKTLMLAAGLSFSAAAAHAADTVRVSLFSWPGYGFWFIAQEKNLVPDLDLEITIIEDPYESFSLMSAGALDVTSSTAEYGPIAADKEVPVKLVTYTNPSYGTDKIVLAPGVDSAEDLKGESVAVLEGGLTQIFMGIWLEQNGVSIKDVQFTNLIMDDAVGALVGGNVKAAEFWEPFGSQALEALPGVGRKTANVVLNTAFGQPTMAVDTHIFRVSNRTGIAPGKNVLEVEKKLLKFVPRDYLLDAHHWLILHGRYVCTARKPRCGACRIEDLCEYKAKTSDD